MHKKKLILGYTLIELLVVIGMVGVLTTGLIVLINPAHQLKKDWFDGKEKVGVTAGASTPDYLIEEVVSKIRKIGN